MKYIFSSSKDEILASHQMKEETLNIMFWGGEFKETPFKEWKEKQTPEKIQEYLDKGFCTEIIEFILHGGDFGKLLNLDGKKKEGNS